MLIIRKYFSVLTVEEKPGLITNAGNSTQIGCSIFNSDIRPKMRWFRNDHQIQDSRKYNINKTFSENSTDSILTVNNVGEFACNCSAFCLLVTYGTEIWPIKDENLHSLVRAGHMMVRWMCGVPVKRRKLSEVLYSAYD